MCGRFTLRTPPAVLVSQFGAVSDVVTPRFNIAPTQMAFVFRERELVPMRWGLAGQPSLINARSETVAKKPAFRDAFQHRRCLVPADGFYEWLHSGKQKRPYHFALKDGGLFAFAGLWEGPAGGESFTILTTTANELVAPLHDRMPVMLDTASYDAWLAGADESLLRPYPAERMLSTPVSPRVNSVAHDDPACLAPVPPDRLLF